MKRNYIFIFQWLDSQNLVQSLVALLGPEVDSERHFNVSQLLCDILRISREALADHRERMDSDPILTRLESPETVELMLEHAFRIGPNGERSESSIVGCVQVLLALLGQRNTYYDGGAGAPAFSSAYDDLDSDRKNRVAESTARAILIHLKELHEVLLGPPKRAPVKTSVGTLEPPLGNTRLQVVRLISALIAADVPELLREIMSLGTVAVLLDLFFKYVWNNFLHAQVERCLAAAFRAQGTLDVNTDENAMYPYVSQLYFLLSLPLKIQSDHLSMYF